MIRTLSLLVCCFFLSSCAAVGIIYTNNKTARTYRAATPNEVKAETNDKLATGNACTEGVLGLVSWGSSGYDSAVENALLGAANSAVLYDVKSDTEIFSILGIYNKLCTRVTGKVGMLK